MNAEDEKLVDQYLASGGFMTMLEEDENGDFVEIAQTDSKDKYGMGTEIAATPPDQLPAGFICPFVPTSTGRIKRFINSCKPPIGKDDVVVDLGSGDGRVVIEIVKETKCRGIGIEIDPKLHKHAADQTAIYAGTDNPINHIKWICDDVRNFDFKSATVVILYLIPSAINQLSSFLLQQFVEKRFRLYSFVYRIPWDDMQEVANIKKIDEEYSLYEYELVLTQKLVD